MIDSFTHQVYPLCYERIFMLRRTARVVLCCLFLLVGMSQVGCRSRVCTSLFLCGGYGCEELLCKVECQSNNDCDQTPRKAAKEATIPSGYVCQSNRCVCDPSQPSAYCHRECHTATDCNKVVDPVTRKAMTTKLGFVCLDPASGDVPDGAKPGQCVCPSGKTCP